MIHHSASAEATAQTLHRCLRRRVRLDRSERKEAIERSIACRLAKNSHGRGIANLHQPHSIYEARRALQQNAL